MKDDDKTKVDLTIGSKIKIGRTEYTIIAEFKDNNKKYFVGKYKIKSCDIFSYSNIICWNQEDKRWFLRR